MNKKISIVGGDARSISLVKMLAEDGHEVSTYGLDKASNLKNYINIRQCSTIEEAIETSNIIIGPIPVTKDKETIHMPFSEEKLKIETFFQMITNEKLVIAGNINKKYIEELQTKDIKVVDLLKCEELAVLNAISTAEGTISIAIQETPITLYNSNVLVLGFGRTGKVLAKTLAGIGARVYCEARKDVDLAWIKAYGYMPVPLNKLGENLYKFDIIINTIPTLILDEEKLNKVKKDCVIIDIASLPGGVDQTVAKEKSIKVICALALPGKVAPVTSAQFIKETIYNII